MELWMTVHESTLRRAAETVWRDAEWKHNGATIMMAQRRHDWHGIKLVDEVGIYWAAITEEHGLNGTRGTEHTSSELLDHLVRIDCLSLLWDESQEILHAAARTRFIPNVHSSSKISTFDW